MGGVVHRSGLSPRRGGAAVAVLRPTGPGACLRPAQQLRDVHRGRDRPTGGGHRGAGGQLRAGLVRPVILGYRNLTCTLEVEYYAHSPTNQLAFSWFSRDCLVSYCDTAYLHSL
jgi:hypothetical protein